jgi:hypothetical protein
MDGVTLMSERQRLVADLFKAINTLPVQGVQAAQAEQEYKIALSKRTLELKQCGYPVTVIQDITRGDKEVAGLRFARDVERESTKALYERINALKFQLRIIQDDIKLEWQRSDMR